MLREIQSSVNTKREIGVKRRRKTSDDSDRIGVLGHYDFISLKESQ